jgi:hypothetical protein
MISGFIAREVGRDVVDSIALRKGKDAPSVERDKAKAAREATSTKKWKASHGGAAAEPGIGAYLGRILSNSVEAWADRSTKRHRRRKMLAATTAESKDSKWLENKLRRTDKRAARAQKVAGWFRGAWGTLADRAEAEAWMERERREVEVEARAENEFRNLETEAHAENRRREDETFAWAAHERRVAEAAAAEAAAGTAGADSTADDPGDVPPRTTSGRYDKTWSHAGWYGASRSTRADHEPDPPAPEAPVSTGPVKATAERLDDDGNPVADAPTGPLLLPPAPLQLEAAPADTDPAGTPAVSPTATTTEDITMTASAEITNLAAAKAYTAKMDGYLDQLAGLAENYQAELTQLGKDIDAEIGDAELAASSLAAKGLGGSEAVAQLQIANEQLGLMKGATEAAAGAIAPMHDQVTSTKAAYATATTAFNAADGVAEQAQAQAATGNLANDTAFYTNV